MASKSLGTLTVDLIVKAGGFKQGMTEAERASEEGAKKIERRQKLMAARLDSNFKAIKSFGVSAFTVLGTLATAGAAAVGVASAAILTTVRKGIDAADQLDEAAQRTAISVETLSKLKLTGGLMGVEFEEIIGGFERLNKGIIAAQDPASRIAKIFDTLKISTKDASGGLITSEEAFYKLATGISEIESQTLKVAVAQELFGKSGGKFLEFLSLGEQGIRKYYQQMEEANAVITGESATAAAAFNDQMSMLGATLDKVGADIAANLLPSVIENIKAFSDWTSEASNVEAVGSILNNLFDLFKITIESVAGVLGSFSVSTGNTSGKLGDLNSVASATQTIFGAVGTVVRVVAGAINAFVSSIQAATNVTIGFIQAYDALRNLSQFNIPGAKMAFANSGASFGEAGRQIARPFGRGPSSQSPQENKPANLNEAIDSQAARDVKSYMRGNGAIDNAAKAREVALQGLFGAADKKPKSAGAAKQTEEEKEAERLQKAYESLIESQKEAMFVAQQMGESARMEFELTHGSLKNLSELEKQSARDKIFTQEQARLEYDLTIGSMKALTDAQKEELRLGQLKFEQLNRLQDAQEEERNNRADDQEYAERLLKDLQHEYQLIGKTADEQERLNVARSLGSALTSEQGKKVMEQLAVNQEWQKQVDQQIEAMDTVRSSFTNAFQEWIGGTKSFKDAFLGALDTINAKILSMISDNLMEQLLGGMGGGGGGKSGGGWASMLGSLFSSGGSGGASMGGGGGWMANAGAGLGGGWGMANGGNPQPFSIHRVNERGPELLSVGNRDYLMMGNRAGKVTPNHQIGKDNGFNQTNNFVVQGKIDKRTELQMAMSMGQRAQLAQRRNG